MKNTFKLIGIGLAMLFLTGCKADVHVVTDVSNAGVYANSVQINMDGASRWRGGDIVDRLVRDLFYHNDPANGIEISAGQDELTDRNKDLHVKINILGKDFRELAQKTTRVFNIDPEHQIAYGVTFKKAGFINQAYEIRESIVIKWPEGRSYLSGDIRLVKDGKVLASAGLSNNVNEISTIWSEASGALVLISFLIMGVVLTLVYALLLNLEFKPALAVHEYLKPVLLKGIVAAKERIIEVRKMVAKRELAAVSR